MMVTNRSFFSFCLSEIESHRVASHLPWPESQDKAGFKLPALPPECRHQRYVPLCTAVFFKCIFVCIRICIHVSIHMWVCVGMHMKVKG